MKEESEGHFTPTVEMFGPNPGFPWLNPEHFGTATADLIGKLNRDSDEIFVAEVQRHGNRTREALDSCRSNRDEEPKTSGSDELSSVPSALGLLHAASELRSSLGAERAHCAARRHCLDT
ncbi:hypothetical protein EYF80_063060 [Liparis tanakae]|uniref:Uncharacterized protein n=1 Tax=Liparis tanakae TaxID=230148 RepID=A0A4Z2EDK4_9TELE|nr:hypothetical protein EYF80_063060 [Liparis tanakae]